MLAAELPKQNNDHGRPGTTAVARQFPEKQIPFTHGSLFFAMERPAMRLQTLSAWYKIREAGH